MKTTFSSEPGVKTSVVYSSAKSYVRNRRLQKSITELNDVKIGVGSLAPLCEEDECDSTFVENEDDECQEAEEEEDDVEGEGEEAAVHRQTAPPRR